MNNKGIILSEEADNTTSEELGKDVTNDIEVDKSEVDIFSIRELAPKSAPITIPYMEIYRTNELEYIPYISPYNVGVSSSSDDSSDNSSNTTSESADNSTDTNTSANSSSDDSANNDEGNLSDS